MLANLQAIHNVGWFKVHMHIEQNTYMPTSNVKERGSYCELLYCSANITKLVNFNMHTHSQSLNTVN